MYHRLMRFVEDAKANESLSDYDSKHKATLEAMKEAEEYIQHFREYQGFQGQTGDAIDQTPSTSGLNVLSAVLSYGALAIWPQHRLRSRCAAS